MLYMTECKHVKRRLKMMKEQQIIRTKTNTGIRWMIYQYLFIFSRRIKKKKKKGKKKKETEICGWDEHKKMS